MKPKPKVSEEKRREGKRRVENEQKRKWQRREEKEGKKEGIKMKKERQNEVKKK